MLYSARTEAASSGRRSRLPSPSPPRAVAVPENSLLHGALSYLNEPGAATPYMDTMVTQFAAPTPAPDEAAAARRAEELLDAMLEAFVERQPVWITNTQAFRNVLVTPLGLRTSPIGCPASSLVSDADGSKQRRGKYTVLNQWAGWDEARGQYATEVLLGANDKHLDFRSTVRVEYALGGPRGSDDTLECSLGNLVSTQGDSLWRKFGAVYLAVIEPAHQRAIAPGMLANAVDWALRLKGDAIFGEAPA